jgi:hypothetical protein
MLPALIVVDHPLSSDVGQNPRIEAALDATTDFMIDPQPLKEAIEFIAQRFHIPVLFDTRTLEDASIDTSTEVKLPTVGLKLRQMLTLLFQQLPQPLGFDVQDGVLRISTIEAIRQNTYVVVYDCRDLIHLSSIYPGAGFQTQTRQQSGAMGGGGGVFSADPEPIDISQKGAASSGKSQQKANPSAKPTCAAAEIPLIRVIRYAGDANDWQDEEGGGPKVTEIGGLLVVNQNSMVHEQIKRILADLRRMRTEGAFATLETPRTAVPSKPSAGSKESGL